MAYLILAISILFTVAAQLLLKKGALGMNKFMEPSASNMVGLAIGIFKNIYLVSGLVLWGVAFLCWLFVLQKMKLSIAYPLANVLNISLIVLGSVIFFKEDFSAIQSFGILFILAGIFMLWKI